MGSVGASVLLGTRGIDLEIDELSGEVILGPSSLWGYSQDNQVLGRRRSDLGNGEMMLWGDVTLAHLVIYLQRSTGKMGHMSRSWCKSKLTTTDTPSISSSLGLQGEGVERIGSPSVLGSRCVIYSLKESGQENFSHPEPFGN